MLTTTNLRASQGSYKVLFLQAYTEQTPGSSILVDGLKRKFNDSEFNIQLYVRYLDSDYYAYAREQEILR